MTARRPADIANDLRRVDSFGWVNTREAIATEVEALPVLTAEEVADLRAVVELLSAWDEHSPLGLAGAAVARVLDRIDPPQVEPEPVVTLTGPVNLVEKLAESIERARADRRPS